MHLAQVVEAARLQAACTQPLTQVLSTHNSDVLCNYCFASRRACAKLHSYSNVKPLLWNNPCFAN